MRSPLHAWVSTIRLLFIPHVSAMTPQHAHPGGVPIRARRMSMIDRSSCLSITPPERPESPQKPLRT